MRTMNNDPKGFERFGVNDIHMMEAVFGLNGEVGEVTDLYKKYLFQGHPFDLEKFKEDFGDMLWYMALFAKALGIPLSEIGEYNIKKNSKYDFRKGSMLKKGFTGKIFMKKILFTG